MMMTKEIVLLYFRNKNNFQEDKIVEDWLNSSSENTRQAMKWLDELSDEEEKLYLKVVLSGNEVWKKTTAGINLQEPGKKEKKNAWIRAAYRRLYPYAALMISIFMLVFSVYVYRIHSFIEVKTDPGIVKKVNLPDGSSVFLNGESQLKYASSWKNKQREVWLLGEAFFNVKRTADNSVFKVYLTGDKTIETLETEFDVSDGAVESFLFLKSGKIVLHHTNDSAAPNITLIPGQLLKWDADKNKPAILQKIENAEKYYSWTKPNRLLTVRH